MKIDPKAQAQSMIRSYGWSVARRIAEAEAAPHSPTGNLDGFWTRVLTEINGFHAVGQNGESPTYADLYSGDWEHPTVSGHG